MESEGLKVFLRSVGDAVYSLNTICIGLNAVSRGGIEKPDDLTISWDTNDPKQTSMQARSFAVRSSLVFVEEALLEYFKYLSNCPEQPPKIVTAVNADGTAKKVEELSTQVPSLESYWMPMVVLLVRWRNQVVHNSKTSLSSNLRKTLLENADVIKDRHAAIDIAQTLSNLDARKITLKDFTTLISVTIRYVRHLDQKLAPHITSSTSLRNQIVARELVSDYKNVLGVNGEDKQKKKFDNFIRSNFPSLIGALSDALFKMRHEVAQEL
jgi:hypothetical protein